MTRQDFSCNKEASYSTPHAFTSLLEFSVPLTDTADSAPISSLLIYLQLIERNRNLLLLQIGSEYVMKSPTHTDKYRIYFIPVGNWLNDAWFRDTTAKEHDCS